MKINKFNNYKIILHKLKLKNKIKVKNTYGKKYICIKNIVYITLLLLTIKLFKIVDGYH